MSAPTQNVLESMERCQAQLQHNFVKLKKALSHWTILEAEYQMLKAELEAVGNPTVSRMREIAQALHCTLVNEHEIEGLLGKDLQTKRDAGAVVHLLAKRIDYVQQNSSSIEKQLDTAEKQLAGLDILLEPGMDSEDGLPMMDIEEELDEEGNELSSSVTRAGEGAVEMVQALRKVGMQRSASTKEKFEQKIEGKEEKEKENEAVAKADFAHPESTPDVLSTGVTNPLESSGGTKGIEIDGNDNVAASNPAIPQDESPEDAELRRQMLQYCLNEVGQAVAELDLDYPTVRYSDEEDEDEGDDDNDFYSTEDEEEDEYGRSTKPVVTEEYRKQMKELEQRLCARAVEDVDNRPDSGLLAEHFDDVRTMRVRKDDEFDSSSKVSPAHTLSASSQAESTTKNVRFADDVAEPEVIKVSRFRNIRGESKQSSSVLPTALVAAPTIPSGPPGRTLASTIIEHSPSYSRPLAPDEFDPIAVRREINVEYHKARNKFIRQ